MSTSTTTKRCHRCHEVKPITDFHRDKYRKDGLQAKCKSCGNAIQQVYLQSHPEAKIRAKAYLARPEVKAHRAAQAKVWNRNNAISVLLTHAKKRARELELPFTLTKADINIPTICPALNIPLQISNGKHSDNSPTLDRIVPDKGYVSGNVVVLSFRANRIKSDASLQELELITSWLRKVKNQ